MSQPKRVFSGIQPTAVMTIGNYFGAVKNWVRLQDECESIYCVVDLHAMTRPYEAEALRASTRDMFVSLLAAGLDPDRCTVFVQSTVPEHTELCWVLVTLASLGDLSRMTQFKEKAGIGFEEADDDGEFVSSGLLFYPVLQAADILAYRAQYVPVGQDQAQHLELSRGVGAPLQLAFRRGVPRARNAGHGGPQGPLHRRSHQEDEQEPRREALHRALRGRGVGAPEDPLGRDGFRDTPAGEVSPGIENLLTLLTACGRGEAADTMRDDYLNGTLRYVDLKGETADALVELTAGMRARREEILRQETALDDRIFEMAAKARSMASETLALVRDKAGFTIRR